jgi:NADH pyrophosphatase NudC (nudix superfamily)
MFHADIDISEIKMQETEVGGVQWVNRDVLFDMLHSGKFANRIEFVRGGSVAVEAVSMSER